MISILLSVILFLPTAIIGKNYFTAAVFEHRPQYANETTRTPSEIIAASLSNFGKATVLAAQKGADIIVFNEYGIGGYPFTRPNFKNFAENIPDPKKRNFNPCIEETTGRPVLHTLSCLARQNNIYLVANLPDVQPCDETCNAENIAACQTKCPEDDVYFYNTNVAFDRKGNMIARYHKVHPYFEVVNLPDGPEFVTFDTDFGKFGLIVCFDSVFRDSVQLVEEYGIDTMLFPTFWFDDILPLNSLEWQQAWALGNKVNFLAANAQQSFTGSLGSGIYSKEDGALIYTYEPSDTSKLMIANLRIKGTSPIPEETSLITITEDGAFPIIETGDKFPEQCYDKLVGAPIQVSDYRCFKTQTDNYTLVKLDEPEGKAEACHNGFCCELKYQADDMKEDFYLAAFNGLNNVRGHHHWWEEVCLVVRCDPFGAQACALQPSVSKTAFKRASLSAKFTSERIYPTVSNTHFRLAPKTEWETLTTGSETTLKYKNRSMKSLLKIGLYGRKYTSDPPFVHNFA